MKKLLLPLAAAFLLAACATPQTNYFTLPDSTFQMPEHTRGKTETAGLIKSGSSAPVGVIAARIKLNTPKTVPTAIPEAREDAPPDSMTASKTGICIIVIDAFGPIGIMPR